MLSYTVLMICFLLFSKSGFIFCDDSDEQLLNIIQNIDKLNVGYGNTELIQPELLNELPFNEKVQHFHMICKEIQCSYIFSARNYMSLTKSLLENRKLAVSVNANNDQSISFVKIATLMLSNVHNVPAMGSLKNLLWIFLLYEHIADKHIKSAMKSNDDDEDLWPIYESIVLSIHTAVDHLLEEFMETDQCVMFHNKIQPVEYYPENELLELINANYQMTLNQLEDNHKLGLSIDGEEKYSRKVLHLNYMFASILGTLASRRMFKVFYGQESSETIFGYLHQQYQRGSNSVPNTTLSEQIKSLSVFHNDFIELSKLMAIRTVWNYLKTVAAMSMLNGPIVLYLMYNIKKYNHEIISHLKDFTEFFSFTEDIGIKKALSRLQRPIKILSCGSIDDEKDITSAINDIISNLSFKEIMKPMVMGEEQKQNIKYQVEMSRRNLTKEFKENMITWNIVCIKYLVDNAKEAFEGKFNLDVLRSFAQIQNSHVYKRLLQLE